MINTNSASPENTYRVLLVDDSASNIAVGKILLQRIGCDVSIAKNGEEAVQVASNDRFDLILMDISMPVMNGLTATQLLRDHEGPNQLTPVVGVTAHTLESDRRDCLNAGMNDFLPKPITKDALSQIIEQWILKTNESSNVINMESATQASPVLDETLLARLRNDLGDEGFTISINIFLDELKKRNNTLERLNKEGDATGLGKEGHAIKSSAGTFGCPQLANDGKKLEIAGKANDLAECQSTLKPLSVSLSAAQQHLQSYLKRMGVAHA